MKKKLTLLIAVLMLIFAMTACGNKEGTNDSAKQETTSATTETTQESQDPQASMTIRFSIDYPNGQDVEDIKITVPEKSSILDVLKTYAKENNVKLSIDEISDPPYVVAINGVKETDAAGWIYELNDKKSMKPAGSCILSDGDSVEWEFQNWEDLDDWDDPEWNDDSILD